MRAQGGSHVRAAATSRRVPPGTARHPPCSVLSSRAVCEFWVRTDQVEATGWEEPGGGAGTQLQQERWMHRKARGKPACCVSRET